MSWRVSSYHNYASYNKVHLAQLALSAEKKYSLEVINDNVKSVSVLHCHAKTKGRKNSELLKNFIGISIARICRAPFLEN